MIATFEANPTREAAEPARHGAGAAPRAWGGGPDSKSSPLRLGTSEYFPARLQQSPLPASHPCSIHRGVGPAPPAYLGPFCIIFLKVCEQLAPAEETNSVLVGRGSSSPGTRHICLDEEKCGSSAGASVSVCPPLIPHCSRGRGKNPTAAAWEPCSEGAGGLRTTWPQHLVESRRTVHICHTLAQGVTPPAQG